MYLVDTSVWIDYLQGRDGTHVGFLEELLVNPLAVGISYAIYMEILQGARDQRAFDRLRRYFSTQRFYRFVDPEQTHAAAARIYLDCRRQGVTIRSTLDCLIAQCAMEHGLVLLHHDRDFMHMSAVTTGLSQKHFLGA